MRRDCCCYDWRYDPFARQLVAGAIAAAFAPDEYLVFTKSEWIEDCGFTFLERLVLIPRGYDGKSAKIRCFTDCIKNLNDGYTCGIAERNRAMMEEYLASNNE